MPTNVSPEFRKAQTAFRRAREPDERLALLKEMLRLIPKHKGTEHLQSDIKSKIKDLTEQLQGPKKSSGRSGPQRPFFQPEPCFSSRTPCSEQFDGKPAPCNHPA